MGFLRVVLALVVVAGHSGILSASLAERLPVLAVKCFFCVSGFYMAMVLNAKYDTATWAGRRTFYANRLLRLYPTYLVVLVFALSVAILTNGIPGDGYYSGFFSRFPAAFSAGGGVTIYAVFSQIFIFGQDALLFLGSESNGFFLAKRFNTLPIDHQPWRLTLLPPAWSLSVELAFYAVAPFMARLRPAHLGMVVALAAALRLVAAPYVPVALDPWVYRFFPFEIGTFALGMLGYHLTKIWSPQISKPVARYAAAAATVLAVVASARLPYAALWVPFAMPFVLAALWAWTKRDRLDRAVGELSYALYLVHWPVLAVLDAYHVPGRRFVLVVASLLLAWALTRWVDLPVDRIRQKLAARATSR